MRPRKALLQGIKDRLGAIRKFHQLSKQLGSAARSVVAPEVPAEFHETIRKWKAAETRSLRLVRRSCLLCLPLKKYRALTHDGA